MITGKNHIGYQLLGSGTTTFQTFNPIANESNSWTCIEANSEEIEKATTLAWSAFKTYRKTSDAQRAEFLETIATEIENLGDELIEIYTKESGLPEGRAQGERGRTLGQLRAFTAMLRNGSWKGATIDEAIPDRKPLPKSDIRKTNIPLGPVAVFGASNFPLAFSTAGGDTASALAAGCPVIVKSHPMHAGVGEMVASAIVAAAKKCNMPEGVFSNLNSSGIQVGVQLVKDARIKAVGFTGSINGGRALFDLANARKEPIPVFAEMGSINPVILCPKALENDAVKWGETYAGSITLGTGQFCTNPGLILGIKSKHLDTFCTALTEKIETIAPTAMLHPAIQKAYGQHKEKVSTQTGVEQLTKAIDAKPNYGEQSIVRVSGAEFLNNLNLHQEVFGPFSMVVECEDEAQLLQIIEGLEGQLTGTLIADQSEWNDLENIIDELQQRVGRIVFNGVPTGVEVCPAMHHGGPYPATTNSRYTSVGLHAVNRWIRPISYQDFPAELLPQELKHNYDLSAV